VIGVARLLLVALVILVVMYLFWGRGRASGVRQASQMTRNEALLVLGLGEGASEREITEAHRRLVARVHPDIPGGSTYLAAQINHARDVLLG
jgi:preprotein translocase subunit Sec63